MFEISLAWWEFILRGVVVYIFLLLILRLSGKKQTGQLSPFDLVLLLVLSNAVQNSMNGGDNSLIGGLITAGTLVALNHIVGIITFKSKTLERIIEGKPKILIHNGKIDRSILNKERLTQHELDAALRHAGVLTAEEVHLAIIENNGAISVIPKKTSPNTLPT